jgi:predicted GNAT family acetyltransferase
VGPDGRQAATERRGSAGVSDAPRGPVDCREASQYYPEITNSHPSAEDITEIVVRDNPESRTYDAMLGDEIAGTLVYELEGPRIVLTHTAVQDHLQHRGIGAKLLTAALDDIRSRGLKITILCPVVKDFIGHHPEYADLVDAEHPGV